MLSSLRGLEDVVAVHRTARTAVGSAMFGTGYRSVAARLARDIRGIGFKTADAIAMKLGIEKTAMIRVRAGVSYALTEAMDEGHCGLPADDELVPLAEKLLEVPRNWSAPPLISS